MEKIFMPTQYAKKYASDNEGKDAVINRFRRARKVDEIIDESRSSQKPEWRGDHSFSSDAARYSLTNFVEPEVAREHPDWTTSQVKTYAKERFEKRLAQDLSYEHRETVHEESEVHWHPVQTENGWELATAYGDKLVTLNELWDHTKEYAAFVGNPAAYNPEEHRAQLAMQDALMKDGSHGFVSVLSHPDAVRYVQIWQKSESGDIQSRHVDLFATTGRDFSPHEAADLIYHLADFHGDADLTRSGSSESSYAHFFVSQGHVEVDDVRTIAIAQAVSVDVIAITGVDGPGVRTPDLIGGVVRDTKEAAFSFGKYIHDQIEEKIQSIKLQKSESPEKKISHQKIIRNKNNSLEKRVAAKAETQATPDTKISVSSVPEFTGMKSILAEWWITRTMVVFAPHLPAASAAAALWFSEVTVENKIKASPDMKHTEDAVHQKDASHRGGISHDMLKAWKALVSRVSELRITPGKKERAVIPVNNKLELVTGKKQKQPEGVTDVSFTENKVSKNFAFVYEAARIFADFFRIDSRKSVIKDVSVVGRRGSLPQAESPDIAESALTALVGRLLFAVSMWELSRMPLLVKTDAHPLDPKHKATISFMPEHEREVAEQEAAPAPWILFAIIWYLSMMREAGIVAPVQQQRQATQAKIKKTPLPQHGVIFTYHFVIE